MGIGLGAPTKAGEHGGLSYLYSRGWKSSACLTSLLPSLLRLLPYLRLPSDQNGPGWLRLRCQRRCLLLPLSRKTLKQE